MAVGRQFSTTSFNPAMFKPHGAIESRIEGKLFIQEATGPFNKEILLAMDFVHSQARHLLMEGGPWGALFLFKQSALASPEMLSGLKKYLSIQVTRKNASIATGLVFSPGVEGAALMKPHYLGAWRGAGILCEAFEAEQEGRDWISAQMVRPLP